MNIQSFEKMTRAEAIEYIKFVAELRHTQKRYFATRYADALEKAKRMEKELDELNARLLNPDRTLF